MPHLFAGARCLQCDQAQPSLPLPLAGDEAPASQPAAESAKEVLTAALLRAEAAARQAAHASGANIIRRGRKQALQRKKRKRTGGSGRGSGGSNLKQSQLQLTVVPKEPAAEVA